MVKTYLVTGGAGFIGSNFIIRLLTKYSGVKIINLDALTYAGNPENLKEIPSSENYTFIKGDICDSKIVEDIFRHNEIDYVVHFAAESHVDRSITEPLAFVRTNVLGTASLLNCARLAWETNGGYSPHKKFVHVSTDEVYGALGPKGYFTEESPLAPHSPYSASKASSDMLAKACFDTYKIPVIITRCSNNYGPRQFPEKLIPLVISNALQGREIPVYGDGKQVRDWLYVEDHAKAIELVALKGEPGQVYNIGGHNERFNIDVVNIILEILREYLPDTDPRREKINSGLIRHVEDRKGHDRRYAIDPEKIKTTLGWEPETAFADGIKKTVKWYLDNPQWIGC